MSRYLEMVDSPTHVKKLTLEQLQHLAAEIRHELITVLSKNGGHLGPNLGVVELTIALHRVFTTPYDKFVWDVCHQIYVHKLLTDERAALTPFARLAAYVVSLCVPRASTIATVPPTPERRYPPR